MRNVIHGADAEQCEVQEKDGFWYRFRFGAHKTLKTASTA